MVIGKITFECPYTPAFYLELRERLWDRLRCALYLAYRTGLPASMKHRLGRDQRLRTPHAGA